ncbi:MAG: hypothetical protein IKM25_04750 [Clostridia bacterium]|nr:hypothetical protein [Clostridia bacterium]
MENREIITNKTESAQKDSFGLKIAMAILAVAVVVLTLINAAPFGEKGETNKAMIHETKVEVIRIVNRNTNVNPYGAEEVEQGKSVQSENDFITVDGITAETAATAAVA